MIRSISGFERIVAMDALGMAVWFGSGLGWMAMGVKWDGRVGRMWRYWMFVPRIPRRNGLDILEMRGEFVVGEMCIVEV